MPSPTPSPAAWRLTFAYRDGQVELRGKQKVSMRVPGSDPTEGYQGQTGHWVELRDAAGKVLYRVILHDPMPQYREVHSAQGPATRSVINQPQGSFQVLVPALPEATSMTFFGTTQPAPVPIAGHEEEASRPATPRVGTGPAQPLVSSSLEVQQ